MTASQFIHEKYPNADYLPINIVIELAECWADKKIEFQKKKENFQSDQFNNNLEERRNNKK